MIGLFESSWVELSQVEIEQIILVYSYEKILLYNEFASWKNEMNFCVDGEWVQKAIRGVWVINNSYFQISHDLTNAISTKRTFFLFVNNMWSVSFFALRLKRLLICLIYQRMTKIYLGSMRLFSFETSVLLSLVLISINQFTGNPVWITETERLFCSGNDYGGHCE